MWHKRLGPGWDHRRPEGIDAGLEESFYWEPPTVTWSNATHIAVVEVDIDYGSDRDRTICGGA